MCALVRLSASAGTASCKTVTAVAALHLLTAATQGRQLPLTSQSPHDSTTEVDHKCFFSEFWSRGANAPMKYEREDVMRRRLESSAPRLV
ncbi:hypothetical protein EYF80_029370 [Liparis tanakae]|uniref:Uncharacterized protein n=1 Tax=Liparis tanakae TaxID=230148 RepID=A0A4Z2H450_9TELE|nr:hypothetical protein EYF80_029370 [Liparis tanakae]